jgi:beta-lysine 5,6-aminomutase beta subunit
MGSGVYSTEVKDYDQTLDLSKLRPYGDTTNDAKVQISFSLQVKNDEKGAEAAATLARKMGIKEPSVVYRGTLDDEVTYYIIYGAVIHSVDYNDIHVTTVDSEVMEIPEINAFIKEKIKRKVVVIGACTGTDLHTVGIDAIMNMKGFAGHPGLESYEMFEAYNLGSQVTNEELIQKARDLSADAILVSQIVTQKDVHIENLTELVELLEAEGLRDKVILTCGGPRVSHELAKELGYDAGFSSGTYSENVASFIVTEMAARR